MTEWRIIVSGAPRTKKTHNRVVRAGDRIRVLPSEAWTNWAASATVSRLTPLPWRIPAGDLNICALFYRDANRGDAVGYYQGIADLLERRGIVVNDQQFVSWDGSRLLIDRVRPRVELILTPAVALEVAA